MWDGTKKKITGKRKESPTTLRLGDAILIGHMRQVDVFLLHCAAQAAGKDLVGDQVLEIIR